MIRPDLDEVDGQEDGSARLLFHHHAGEHEDPAARRRIDGREAEDDRPAPAGLPALVDAPPFPFEPGEVLGETPNRDRLEPALLRPRPSRADAEQREEQERHGQGRGEAA